MSALTILAIGFVLILANSIVATLRMLIHIGITKSLIATAVKKASTKAQTEKGLQNNAIAQAFIKGYVDQLQRNSYTSRH